MKKRAALSALDAVFTKLTDQLTKTYFESSFVTSQFQEAIVQLDESLQSTKEFKKSKNISNPIMGLWVALPMVDLSAPETRWEKAGYKKAEEDELRAILIENLNNQHQWLLVEAFEAVETYLQDLYGVLGYLDRSLWRCSDFGDIVPSAISSNDLDWHKQQVRKIMKRNTKEIRNRLNDTIIDVHKYLSRNCRRRDYNFLIGCIETLRHFIVHSSGRISGDDLFQAVNKNTSNALTGNSKVLEANRQFLKSLIDSSVGSSVVEIVLINKANTVPPFHFLNRPFVDLLEHLISYGGLLYSQSLRHFCKEPVWPRSEYAT
ncbi:MAG: hypothetical protein WCO53_06365 [Deltaproteobacteria bacterium]